MCGCRRLAVVPEILGQIDCDRAAPAQLALDRVAVAKRFSQLLDWLGQRRSP